MRKSRWVLKPQPPADYKLDIPEYPEFFIKLLWQRNLRDRKSVDNFLNPSYEESLHDPFSIKNIKEASDRIWLAVEKKEKVVIYGDYDADGICSTVILGEFFRLRDFPFDIYIPDRAEEGHGLNMAAVENFIENKVDLIVTLDCGTTNKEEIARAGKEGVDVIVVDHHQVVGEKPPAQVFVNPHQPGDDYPFKGLCATGLAFKLFQVLVRDIRAEDAREKEKWLLDLAAIGTVADMMPLLDENRVLVKYGLIVLAQTKRAGIKELFRVSNIKPSFSREAMRTNINAMALGFSLGPRINAASRMAHAALAYNLLVSTNPVEARGLALELEESNTRRKREIEYIWKEVDSILKKEKEIPDFIIESSPHWPVSILGLIANRVKEKYARPVMLMQEFEEEAKASLRAPDGFDLVKALGSVSDLLVQFGGHKAAAGGSLVVDNISSLKKRLNDYARENLTEDMRTPKLEIDLKISVEDITLENAEIIQKLDPLGMANPSPLFLVEGAELFDIKFIGTDEKHAKLLLNDKEGKKVSALMFFHKGVADKLEKGVAYDIVGELSVNEWNGTREPQFKIIDIKNNDR